MKKVIGIYSQACNRQRPVIGRAGRLFYLLQESRAVHGLDAIDYAGEQSDHGDFTTVIDTVQGFLEYAALLESGVQPGASGEYDRAVAKGIREAVEEGDLLAIESPREVTDYNRIESHADIIYRDVYDLAVEVYDLPELGSEFVDRGETFTITGFNPRSTKYPVLATRADGKRFKFPVITVLAHGEFP